MFDTNIFQKLRKFINNRLLKTPGVDFLKKNKDINDRKKHINFWINKAKKKKSFQKYFFSRIDNDNCQINFNLEDNQNFLISQEMFHSLSNNGLLILENILPEKERYLIIEFFEELKSRNYTKNRWLKEPNNPNFFDQVDEILGETKIKHFKKLNYLSNQLTKEIYGKVVEPTVQFRFLNQLDSQEEKQVKGATYLHTDRFLPHFKIYYSPFEITVKDAPLEYMISSHKINDNFINYYLNARNFDETDRLFNNFKQKKKNNMCASKYSLCCFDQWFS